MVTEIGRELPIRVLKDAQPAKNSFTEPEQPNSIIHLAPSLNRTFGKLTDEASIFEMARIVPDENSADRRRATVELVGSAWLESGATDTQLGRIRAIFRNLYFKAKIRGININENYTINQLRQDCKDKKLRTIPGVGMMAEEFLGQTVRKRTLQILQGGPAATN
jgi:hypothetical protein